MHASNQASRREFTPSSIFKESGFERRNTLMFPFCPLPRKWGRGGKQWKICIGWPWFPFIWQASCWDGVFPPLSQLSDQMKASKSEKNYTPPPQKGGEEEAVVRPAPRFLRCGEGQGPTASTQQAHGRCPSPHHVAHADGHVCMRLGSLQPISESAESSREFGKGPSIIQDSITGHSRISFMFL